MVDLSNYPKLQSSGFKTTSDKSAEYNCIAWAAGDSERWWWPYVDPPPYSFWPEGVPREETLHAFLTAFRTLGYSPCHNTRFESGFEKVAFFGEPDKAPKHAARQLQSGLWTSKIGRSEDIEHTLAGLGSSHYGGVIQIMKRRAPSIGPQRNLPLLLSLIRSLRNRLVP